MSEHSHQILPGGSCSSLPGSWPTGSSRRLRTDSPFLTHGWPARPLPLAPVPHSRRPCLPPGFRILCVSWRPPPPMGAIVSRPGGLYGPGHPTELSARDSDRGVESWVKQRIQLWKCEVRVRRTVGFHHVRPTHGIPTLPSPRESLWSPRASRHEDPLYPLPRGEWVNGFRSGPSRPPFTLPVEGRTDPRGCSPLRPPSSLAPLRRSARLPRRAAVQTGTAPPAPE